MREGYPEAPSPVTDEQALADFELRRRYREEHIARIKAGEEVLMLRNFHGSSDMETGIIRDFWAGGEQIGHIDCDEDAGIYIAYRRPEGDEEGPQRLSLDELETLSQAEKTLSEYYGKNIKPFQKAG